MTDPAGVLEAIVRQGDERARALLIVAAPGEAKAVLDAAGQDPPASGMPAWKTIGISPHIDLLLTGVGKANAAAGLVRAFEVDAHSCVVNLGVAGMLPGSGLALGQAVAGDRSCYADEGSAMPTDDASLGFQDIASMGFPPDLLDDLTAEGPSSCAADPALLGALRPLADRVGAIATVSTCSGTDDLAWAYAERTGAIAEAMEGAALAFTCLQLRRADGSPVPFAELRVICNTTGDRGAQKWDLPRAFERVRAIASRL